MRFFLAFSFSWLIVQSVSSQDIKILDEVENSPIAFATVAFGDGKGTFANEEGVLRFSKDIYPDVDSLQISSMGYVEKTLSVGELTDTVYLKPSESKLEKVILLAELQGKFKRKKIKAIEHDEYHHSWLPTVESEIARKFERYDGQPTQVTTVLLPIIKEESQRSGSGRLRKFKTLMKINFYNNDGGKPDTNSFYPSKTVLVTEDSDDVLEVDVTEKNISIPENGIFIGVQVLGYADEQGELIPAKKYREIKTRRGIRKISTTYRPLLPFTDEEEGKQTYVRRVFLNNKQWQVYDLSYNPNSALIRKGYDNYGMGARFKVFYQD